jgi:Asp/Glu/hydantoin racemase
MLPAFLAAADELIADGVDGITTNCGFLSLFQAQLAAHCRVPVATSSLMQAPLIQSLLPPDKRVGIITISAQSMSPEHLQAAGVAADTPVVGTDSGREFCRVLLDNEYQLDVDEARRDLLDAGHELIEKYPQVGAVLLECTNMPPYSRDLRQALGLPVFDIVTFINWFHASLAPRGWLKDL